MADEYVTVEEAAGMLGVTTRQANRYGTGAKPKVRTKRAGRRILYHRGDLETLAEELAAQRGAVPPAPAKLADMPSGDVLAYLREKDAQLMELHERVLQLTTENVRLKAENSSLGTQLQIATGVATKMLDDLERRRQMT